MEGKKRMAFRMRSSKFRHVFGSPAKKEQCYECIKITKNAHDSTFCAVNPKFIAIVTESAGGGAFLILPLERVGRVDINAAKVCGHSGPVLDIRWNPFNDNVIASCSDDATVKVWQVPDHGLRTNLSEWLVDLHGHQRRVGFIEWHPTAENILLSAGYDFQCILWNTETAEPINIINVHSDTIFSISWNRDGSLFATTSKDKKIRVIDPREGTVVAEGPGHQGSKASKIVFLGDRNMLFTTGFSRMSERQYGVWDVKKLKEPLKMETVDSSSGVLFPFYDYDTKVVFVAGKGDGNIRYYEITDQPPYVYYLSQYQSSSPQRGLGIMPKRGVDCNKCEIVRFFKLHTIKALCEPISMIVPRKSEMFQEDIFVPTASATPSLTADQWISGMNREPILVSLKDGAVSNVPTITTYKAIKRGTSSITTTTTSSPDPRQKRQATTPPMAAVSPVSPNKLPQSLRNIRKLSSSIDDEHIESIKEGKENINDVINNFERRTNIITKSTTQRLTNANEPLRVDKKVWSSSYTGLNDNENNVTTNGVPRTDPEPMTPEPRTPTSTTDTSKMDLSSCNNHSLSDVELDLQDYDDHHDNEMESSVIEESIAKRNFPGRAHRKWSLKTPDMRVSEKRSRSPSDEHDNDIERVAKERQESLGGHHHRKWSLKPNEGEDDMVQNHSPDVRNNASNKTSLSQLGQRSHSASHLEHKRTRENSHSESIFRQRQDRRSTRTSRSSSRISDVSDVSELYTTPPTSPDPSPGGSYPDQKPDSAGERNHITETPVGKRIGPSNFNTPGGSTVPWKTNPLYDQSGSKPHPKPKSDLDNIKTGLVRNSPFRRSLQVVSKSDLNTSPFVRNQPLRRSHQQSVKTEHTINLENQFTRNSPLRRSLQTHMQSDSRGDFKTESPPISRITPLRSSTKSDESIVTKKHSTPVCALEFNPSIGQSCESLEVADPNDGSFIAMDAFPSSAPDNTLIKPSKLRESMRRNKGRRRTVGDNKYNGDRNNNNFENDVDISPRLLKQSREVNVLTVNPLNTPVSTRDLTNNALNTTRDSLCAFRFVDDDIPDTSITAIAEQNGQFNTTTSSINIDDLVDESLPSKARRKLHADDVSFNVSCAEPSSRLDHSKVEVSETSPNTQSACIVRLRHGPSEHDDTNKVHVKPWQSENDLDPDLDNSSPLTPKDTNNTINGCPEDEAELRKAYFRQVEEIKSLNEQISLKDKRIRQLEEEVRLLRDLHHMDESTC